MASGLGGGGVEAVAETALDSATATSLIWAVSVQCHRSPLSGHRLPICSRCGEKLVARPTRNRRPRHVCSWGPNYGGCIKIGCLAEPVEQLVAEWVIRPLSGPALSAATGRIGPSGSCSTAVGRPGPAGDERPHAPESGGGEPGHGHGLSDAKSETSDAQEDALTATGTGNDAPWGAPPPPPACR